MLFTLCLWSPLRSFVSVSRFFLALCFVECPQNITSKKNLCERPRRIHFQNMTLRTRMGLYESARPSTHQPSEQESQCDCMSICKRTGPETSYDKRRSTKQEKVRVVAPATHTAVPTQCPLSVHTVPTQCPHSSHCKYVGTLKRVKTC